MNLTDTLGLMAGAMTTVSFLPQVIKTWKTKSCKDISIVMFGCFALGVTLWTVYGLLTHSLPIIIANATTLALVMVIIFFKLKYK